MTKQYPQKNLGRSISIGALWMVAIRWTIKSLGLISSIILARLLVPEDFGIIALAMSVYALVRLIREFGFGSALIQNQEAGREQYDTAWTLQLGLSVLAALILVGLAPYASQFYEDDRLTPLLWILSLTFLVSGFSNIGVIDFQKHLNFDKVFLVRVTPKIVSFVTTVSLAIYLRSYWALLIGQFVNSVALVVMSYVMHSYRPRLNLVAWRDLLGFSSWLMLNNVIVYLNRHGRNIVIAKMGGPAMVGLVSVSTDFATIVSQELISPINTAAYPGYAKVSSDKPKLEKSFKDVIGVVSILAIPGAIGIAVIAPLFVPVLLGEKWLETAALITTIAYASIFMSFGTAFDMAFMAIARQRVTTMLVSIRLAAFFILLFYWIGSDGAQGVADAVLISNIVVFPLYLLFVRKYFFVTVTKFASLLYRPAIASLVMYYCTAAYVSFVGDQVLDIAGILCVAMAVLVGFVSFSTSLLGLWVLARSPEGAESRFLNIVSGRVRSLFHRLK